MKIQKTEYTELPHEFSKNGYKMTLLEGYYGEKVGVYSQINKEGTLVGWEVVRIKPNMSLPSNEDWGTHGFTYKSINKAKKKANELLSESC